MLLLVETALAKVDAFCVNLLTHIRRSPWVTNCACPGWRFGLVPTAVAAVGVVPVAAGAVTLNGFTL